MYFSNKYYIPGWGKNKYLKDILPPAALRGPSGGAYAASARGRRPLDPLYARLYLYLYVKDSTQTVFLQNSPKNNLRVSHNIEKQPKPCVSGVQGEPPPGAPRVGAAGGTGKSTGVRKHETGQLQRGRSVLKPVAGRLGRGKILL